MKIAIHHRPGSFSDRWIGYCEKQGIDYKIVNAYSDDIVKQVVGCDAFMWHHHHAEVRDTLFARQLLYSLETSGMKCFPDFRTTWHFDDKVGQKYLLEAIKAPLVPSYVFYNEEDALLWAEKTTYPKVFKLRGGAGSSNVLLVRNIKVANRLIKKAFDKGFPQVSAANIWKENKRKLQEGKISLLFFLKSIASYYLKSESYHKKHNPERGYVYFQDFIPDNTFDIRVCVVGKRAFALKRYVRKGDFRASGSGDVTYDVTQIDIRCVKTAFELNKELRTQCVAFDFVFDENNNPLIVEISYGFASAAYDKCEGWWDEELYWHAGCGFDFCGWMVESVVSEIESL